MARKLQGSQPGLAESRRKLRALSTNLGQQSASSNNFEGGTTFGQLDVVVVLGIAEPLDIEQVDLRVADWNGASARSPGVVRKSREDEEGTHAPGRILRSGQVRRWWGHGDDSRTVQHEQRLSVAQVTEHHVANQPGIGLDKLLQTVRNNVEVDVAPLKNQARTAILGVVSRTGIQPSWPSHLGPTVPLLFD